MSIIHEPKIITFVTNNDSMESFKVPYDLDLDNETIVKSWDKRRNHLCIEYTNGTCEYIPPLVKLSSPVEDNIQPKKQKL